MSAPMILYWGQCLLIQRGRALYVLHAIKPYYNKTG
jgi:hypothetical protein